MHAATDSGRWHARLDLSFARRGAETALVEKRHTGPLRVQRPFYPEARDICHVYLLHPPGGLVSGDQLEIDIHLGQASWALLTTPGAGKFYRNDGLRPVSLQQNLSLEEDAVLEWLPQEGILFDGTRADILTRVNLQGSARFMGWEITCMGRPACNEKLQSCDLRQRFEIWRAGQPVWLERSRYDDYCAAFDSSWGLQGHTVIGTLVCTNKEPSIVANVRQQLPAESSSLLAVTQLGEVLVCRYLGDHTGQAREQLCMVWKILRQQLFGRTAVAPRIWNT